jgi:hypothetical protein
MGMRGVSSSVIDVDHYIIRKLLDYIFNILLVFIHQWEIQTYSGLSFCRVAYTRYDLPWFIE